MLQATNTLYWVTPFFTRQELRYILNQCSSENYEAFYCFDSRWNKVNQEDLLYLKNELQKHGVKLFMMEAPVEKAVPSAARVLKARRVIFSGTDLIPEFEIVIKKICRELELHSIAFSHNAFHFSFYHRSDFHGLRHTF